MAQRRWIDGPILGKMLGGLALMALPAASWYLGGFLTLRGWILGALGLMLFFWGLLSIGDKKSGWE